MQNPIKSPTVKTASGERTKLFIALGLFAIAGVVVAWQFLGGGDKRTVDPALEAQQQAIMEQVGASKQPAPEPPPPVAPEEKGRGPRTVKRK